MDRRVIGIIVAKMQRDEISIDSAGVARIALGDRQAFEIALRRREDSLVAIVAA